MMEYSITGSEVAELISCKKQDVYNSTSYGQMIRKEFYVEVVDRPLSRTKDLVRTICTVQTKWREKQRYFAMFARNVDTMMGT